MRTLRGDAPPFAGPEKIVVEDWGVSYEGQIGTIHLVFMKIPQDV